MRASSSVSSSGRVRELVALDADLALVELARALHRYPLAQGHRERAGEEAGHARHEDLALAHAGARHAHHEAVDRQEPVVGAEGARPQGVAARAVPALEAGDLAPGQAPSRLFPGEDAEDAGVGPLLAGHPDAHRVALAVVAARRGGLDARDGADHRLGSVAGGEAGGHPRLEGGAEGGDARPGFLEPLLPEGDVPELGLGQLAVQFRQAGVGLDLGEAPVEEYRVALAAQVGAQSLDVVVLHGFEDNGGGILM